MVILLSENYVGDSDDKVNVNEHRIFQQLITKQKFGKLGIQAQISF